MGFIHLDSVSLSFPVYGAGKRILKKELVRIATGGVLKRQDDKLITVTALKNITLTVPNGMRLALIGHNGSGKTTLLRLLSGIYEPTSGHVAIKGHITSLLDIMISMDEESTGYECIKIRGLLQGLTLKQIKEKTQEIIDFTELGDYLYMPLRTYSSGMRMRLAFGIATSVAPEILLIDEIFGAGDSSFITKAKDRMHQMVETSSIVVFTSHDLALLKSICTHALWLDAGEPRFFGPIEAAITKYFAHYKIQPLPSN